MENYEDDVERFLRLSLVAVASIALLGLILFMWSPAWLVGEEPDPLQELAGECESAGGRTVRGVMREGEKKVMSHFTLCLPQEPETP